MSESETAYRILDASTNRASEGLRTMEEFARFGLNDVGLAGELKSLRHQLTASLAAISRESMLMARDTEADVGTSIREVAEYDRPKLVDVIRAASARVQQSLRVLEEYSKLIDRDASQQIERLRYRAYTLSAQLELCSTRLDALVKLDQSRLYVLIDADANETDFIETVIRLAQSDVDILQLRDRSVDDRTLLQRARLGTKLARDHGKLFIMNDRADLAVAADTDGVHVGQDELPAADARKIVGANRLVGVSTHSIGEARAAEAAGADYIGCGPVFPGRTKKFDAYVGTLMLEQVAAEIAIPAFAIGGIDASNVDRVIGAGIRRVAVTGAIRDAEDPASAAAALRSALSQSAGQAAHAETPSTETPGDQG